MTQTVRDALGRPLRNLRISVTDRCNLRCRYCMPEEEYVWLPKQSLLTFEEIDRLVGVFATLGVEKIRLTGGEPLLRKDLPDLVRRIASHDAIRDVAMTTNGVLLARALGDLRRAGLHRLTISLDTLRPDRFKEFVRSDRIDDVLRSLREAEGAGFSDTKINTVVTRGVNDDEIADLLRFAATVNAEVRFIEYMDVGGATQWRMEKVVTRTDILALVEAQHGSIETLSPPSRSAPAERFRLGTGQVFGVIASTTAPFCRTCDRARITADGMLFHCLYGDRGLNLRDALRDGSSDVEIADTIGRAWESRRDRGAEVRLHAPERQALYQIDSLRSDPHREMHTRGG